MTYPFEIVWMTTQATATPHAAALQAANPGCRVHTCHSRQGATPDEFQLLWRNCDRNIREWWRANSAIVSADAILFLEYDVYCDVDLRPIIPPLPPGAGVAGPRLMSCVRDLRGFRPFADIPRLPRDMQGLALAAAPLAVLLVSRAALNALLAPAYDAVFAADIFSEVRLPTVIRHAGFSVVSMDLALVGCTPCRPTHPDLWHPVKSAVPALPSLP